jgi:beta-galactosidase
VYVLPYWDFNPGQLLDVRVISNAPEVELFVNGKSQGRKRIDHEHGTVLSADHRIPYEPGEITAVAYDEEGREIARQSRHSFGDAKVLKAELYDPGHDFTAGCGDMCFIAVSALDENGYPVDNARYRVRILVSGGGYLMGTDNGDSADPDGYKQNVRRLFGGKLLAIIGSNG